MKSIVAVSLTTVAALVLGACSPSEPVATNLSNNEAALNEADIPAEGNAGEDYGNSTLGFDNTLDNAGLGNDLTVTDNATANTR